MGVCILLIQQFSQSTVMIRSVSLWSTNCLRSRPRGYHVPSGTLHLMLKVSTQGWPPFWDFPWLLQAESVAGTSHKHGTVQKVQTTTELGLTRAWRVRKEERGGDYTSRSVPDSQTLVCQTQIRLTSVWWQEKERPEDVRPETQKLIRSVTGHDNFNLTPSRRDGEESWVWDTVKKLSELNWFDARTERKKRVKNDTPMFLQINEYLGRKKNIDTSQVQQGLNA